MLEKLGIIAAVIVVVLMAAYMVTGKSGDEKAYDWSVEFCGGKENIKQFSAMGLPSVECSDGRKADVP